MSKVIGPSLAGLTAWYVGIQLSAAQAPQKDIGSYVKAGEMLMVLEAPELLQDVEQKEAIWKQRTAELEQARTLIATLDASVGAALAQQRQAQADIKRTTSEHVFLVKQLHRLKQLVKDRTSSEEMVDEKEHQVNAAEAAVESSCEKAKALQAEIAVVSSKLATARADLLVKEALIEVARKELNKAQSLADYAVVRAPFDGIITYRGVDEGDFVQNSSSGQTRLLMTVCAIDKVKVVLELPEREAVWVRPSKTQARVHFDARTSWDCTGHVTRIGHSLDNQSRTMRVEIDLDNRERTLLPGMYGKVTLTLQEIKDAWTIPATAVYTRKGESYVLQVQSGIARRQRVRIRYDDGKELEVLKLIDNREVPLLGSEELIISNKGEIADGQRVTTPEVSVRPAMGSGLFTPGPNGVPAAAVPGCAPQPLPSRDQHSGRS